MSSDTAASYTTFSHRLRDCRRKIATAAATVPVVMEDRSEPPEPQPRPQGPQSRPDGSDGPAVGAKAVDWAAALQDHARWLRRVILTRLGERQAVDEVMQEVCLAAVAQPARSIDAERVGAWLYGVAVRQTLLYRRKSGRRRKLIDAVARFSGTVRGGDDGEGTSRGGDPLGWLLSAERGELVRQALSRLPPRDADVLVLKYTEQWSYRELAEHLGTTESAVEARLHRARQRLRHQLAKLRLDEDNP